jgi:hypothetical protein
LRRRLLASHFTRWRRELPRIARMGRLIYMENYQSTNQDSNEAEVEKEAFRALQAVVAALQPLSSSLRSRVFRSAGTFLRIEGLDSGGDDPARSSVSSAVSRYAGTPSFSADTNMSPKEFILEKQPRTDVERVACLAAYLTHYRDTANFKTLDLSKLNTEAAQPKFSNAANATNNAVKMGYLVPSAKGFKQLGAAGEQFVRALPDREAAKAAMAATRPRRKRKRAQMRQDSHEA